jgi:hypothetical protein
MPTKINIMFGSSYSGHVNLGDIIMGMAVHFASSMTLPWLGDLCVIDNTWLMAAVSDGYMRFK